MHDNDWYCRWCGDIDADMASGMQPAFCLDCVQAMLQGRMDERKAKAAAKRAAWLRNQRRLRQIAVGLGMKVFGRAE